jgi:hypothetical protein
MKGQGRMAIATQRGPGSQRLRRVVLAALVAGFAGGLAAVPARAEDHGWHGRGHHEEHWRHGHEHEWRHHRFASGYYYVAPRPVYVPPAVYAVPPAVYAPPPVIYAPPPDYAPTASINLIFPFGFR